MSDEANGGSWFRLQAAFFIDPKIMRVGPHGALVFLAALTKAKSAGYRKGRLPKDDLAPDILARYIGLPEDVMVTSVTKCVEVGLLIDDGGPDYVIAAWHKYQQDPGVAGRVAKCRAAKRELVTGSNGSNGDVTGRDVTGRDGTRQDIQRLGANALSQSETPQGNDLPEEMHFSPLLKPGVNATFAAMGVRFNDLPGSRDAWSKQVNALSEAGVKAEAMGEWLMVPDNRLKPPWGIADHFKPNGKKPKDDGPKMTDAEARALLRKMEAEKAGRKA